MKRLFSVHAVIDYLFITIGSFIMATGISLFLIDAKVVPGGVTGISMAIHYLSENSIPVGANPRALNVLKLSK